MLTFLSVLFGYLFIGVVSTIFLRVVDRWFPSTRLGFGETLDPSDRALSVALWPIIVPAAIWIILTDPKGPNVWGRAEDFVVDLLSPPKKRIPNDNA